jgi:Nucleotidyl transferase AbiEii toxin, Type IV TA system
VNIELLERAAVALGELVEDVMFVGGATIELWLTDPGAVDIRPTLDVDVVVEVTSRLAFHNFEAELRRRGFAEAQASGVICRWEHSGHDLTLDAMPARAEILGFENRWQAAALPHAVRRDLPSGATIRAASPPYLLAMKLEAFRGRGKGDFIASRDFEDIVTLLDRRPELIAELRSADAAVRGFVAGEMQRLLGKAGFPDGVAAALPPDAASQERAREVIRPAFEALADLAADA